MTEYIVSFTECGMDDVGRVGGKNASLGEMISALSSRGVSVPGGFATTAEAFRDFLAADGLGDRIQEALSSLDVDDIEALKRSGATIRQWILDAPLPAALEADVRREFAKLDANADASYAVRSSATAEDLPDASFAGQQETLLNVVGIDDVIRAIHVVFASLYNDRAIAYRVHQGFNHADVALSAGVQRMVRSDLGSSGVMFTLDTESGFRDVVFVTSAYGLGESVVQGTVNPDEFYVYKTALRAGFEPVIRRDVGSKLTKMIYGESASERVRVVDVDEAERREFSLTQEEVVALSKQALIIEEHYGRPMDIEWGKDGIDGKLYILQARPETVQSRSGRTTVQYQLNSRGPVVATGRAIGQGIGKGKARVVPDAEAMHLVEQGDVLVTDMTDPDWEPVMKRASAIVTNRGGRTCHAAIIARELGIPAVVGCGDATEHIENRDTVTVSCAEGDEGFVYAGDLDYETRESEVEALPELPVKIMLNVGNPDRAMTFAATPNKGVGLARLEFIINRKIGVHPLALIEFEKQDPEIRELITQQMPGYADPTEFFVARLSEGIATIASAFAPEPVIVRLSDFKSNEYANLIGGARYEPTEENPMLGFRGASRYIDENFRACFELECRALRRVRERMGLKNVWIMVPFVRTLDEARGVVKLLAENGLESGKADLRVIMMCELPSNALLADEFLEYFDGMSIGSNDMTQLTLGLDRDSGKIANLFDERNPAVLRMLEMAISACRRHGKYVGICGQGPSDHPDLAEWLLEQGIESMSLNPDSVVDTWQRLATRSKPA